MQPELGCQEIIEQRVEAAAQARYAQRHRVELTHRLSGAAVGHYVLGHHQVEQEVEVVGGEAEQEQGRAAQHHPQGALLLPVGQPVVGRVRLTVGGDGLKSAACGGVQGGGALLVPGLSLVEGLDNADGAVSDAGQRNEEAKQLS